MNRWVGVVSLRETAAPTPVHRIALAIEAARQRTSYVIGGRQVSYARVRAALRSVGQAYSQRSEWDRYTYCMDLAGAFFNGVEPPQGLPGWLVADLRDALDRLDGPSRIDRSRKKDVRKPTPAKHERRRTRPARLEPAGHGRSVPARPARSTPRGDQRTPEPVRSYRRVERRTAACEVTYPPLPARPAELVPRPAQR